METGSGDQSFELITSSARRMAADEISFQRFLSQILEFDSRSDDRPILQDSSLPQKDDW